MNPIWARQLQRWTATTKKKIEYSDVYKRGVWHTRSTLMHLPAVAARYLHPVILSVYTTGVTKDGAHLHGRLKIFDLFEHLIKQNCKPPCAPSYVNMALEFTKDRYIGINPKRSALLSLGSPIAIDTEGNGAEYAQITDGKRTFILRMCKAQNRDALAELLQSRRHKLFWGDDDAHRLDMHIAEPWTNVQRLYNQTGLKNVAAFLMGVKGGRYEKPHFTFYKQFSCSGILNSEHVAYAVADVLFTLWAYQQKALSISAGAVSTLT